MEGNSYALHASLCLAFPPLEVCGCSVSVVVAVTAVACTFLWGNSEE